MRTILHASFKQRLRERHPLLGTFVKLPAPNIVENLGLLGLDFVVLDMEHGPLTISQIEELVRAADLVQLPAIVRVARNEAVLIQQALDAGAAGVQVPGVQTADELGRVVRAAHYYPKGERGLSFSHRAGRFGTMPTAEYLANSQDAVVIAQAESAQALAALPDMLKVAGLDALFIGPADLSQSLGHPGELNHPAVRETISRALDEISRSEATAGIFAAGAADALRWQKDGATYVTMNSEQGLMARAVTAELVQWRQGLTG